MKGTAECPDPETGDWVVTWTVTSWQPRGSWPTQYQITSLTPGPAGTEVTGIDLNEWRGIGEEFVGQQTVPGDAATATLQVKAAWNNQQTKTNNGSVDRPEPCPEPPAPAPITVDAEQTCDGLTVTATNPGDGVDAGVVFTPSTGDPVGAELAPGESTQREFEAGDGGLTVVVTVDDEELETFVWVRPEDCDEPGEPEEPGEPDEPGNGEGGGDDEELPVTGFAAGAAIVGAMLLLTLGAGMFLVARRRRITFTA